MAKLSDLNEYQLVSLGVKVVHGHVAIIEAADDHVGVVGVEVHTHHAGGGGTHPLGVGGILQGVQTDVALARLLVEVVGAEADSEEVAVLRVPAEGGHLQIFGLAQGEPPQGQQTSLHVLDKLFHLEAVILPSLSGAGNECHKHTAQGTQSAILGSFIALHCVLLA